VSFIYNDLVSFCWRNLHRISYHLTPPSSLAVELANNI
jgi:hypothetical protein